MADMNVTLPDGRVVHIPDGTPAYKIQAMREELARRYNRPLRSSASPEEGSKTKAPSGGSLPSISQDEFFRYHSRYFTAENEPKKLADALAKNPNDPVALKKLSQYKDRKLATAVMEHARGKPIDPGFPMLTHDPVGMTQKIRAMPGPQGALARFGSSLLEPQNLATLPAVGLLGGLPAGLQKGIGLGFAGLQGRNAYEQLKAGQPWDAGLSTVLGGLGLKAGFAKEKVPSPVSRVDEIVGDAEAKAGKLHEESLREAQMRSGTPRKFTKTEIAKQRKVVQQAEKAHSDAIERTVALQKKVPGVTPSERSAYLRPTNAPPSPPPLVRPTEIAGTVGRAVDSAIPGGMVGDAGRTVRSRSAPPVSTHGSPTMGPFSPPAEQPIPSYPPLPPQLGQPPFATTFRTTEPPPQGPFQVTPGGDVYPTGRAPAGLLPKGEDTRATQKGQVQEGPVGEHPGVPPRQDLRANQGKARQGSGRQAGRSGSVQPKAAGGTKAPKASAVVVSADEAAEKFPKHIEHEGNHLELQGLDAQNQPVYKTVGKAPPRSDKVKLPSMDEERAALKRERAGKANDPQTIRAAREANRRVLESGEPPVPVPEGHTYLGEVGKGVHKVETPTGDQYKVTEPKPPVDANLADQKPPPTSEAPVKSAALPHITAVKELGAHEGYGANARVASRVADKHLDSLNRSGYEGLDEVQGAIDDWKELKRSDYGKGEDGQYDYESDKQDAWQAVQDAFDGAEPPETLRPAKTPRRNRQQGSLNIGVKPPTKGEVLDAVKGAVESGRQKLDAARNALVEGGSYLNRIAPLTAQQAREYGSSPDILRAQMERFQKVFKGLSPEDRQAFGAALLEDRAKTKGTHTFDPGDLGKKFPKLVKEYNDAEAAIYGQYRGSGGYGAAQSRGATSKSYMPALPKEQEAMSGLVSKGGRGTMKGMAELGRMPGERQYEGKLNSTNAVTDPLLAHTIRLGKLIPEAKLRDTLGAAMKEGVISAPDKPVMVGGREVPSQLISLAERTGIPEAELTHLGIPKKVRIDSRALRELEPIFSAVRDTHTGQSSLLNIAIRGYLMAPADVGAHTMTLASLARSRPKNAISTSIPAVGKVLSASQELRMGATLKDILNFAHPEKDRIESGVLAARAGVFKLEPRLDPTQPGKMILYGRKGVYANALTGVYRMMKGMGASDEEIVQAYRTLPSHAEFQKPSVQKELQKFGMGTFYQTGAKGLQAGFRHLKDPKGIAASATFLTLAGMLLDHEHKPFWDKDRKLMPGQYAIGKERGKLVVGDLALNRITRVAREIPGRMLQTKLRGGSTEQVAESGVLAGANELVRPATTGPVPAALSKLSGKIPYLVPSKDREFSPELLNDPAGDQRLSDRVKALPHTLLPIGQLAFGDPGEPYRTSSPRGAQYQLLNRILRGLGQLQFRTVDNRKAQQMLEQQRVNVRRSSIRAMKRERQYRASQG